MHRKQIMFTSRIVLFEKLKPAHTRSWPGGVRQLLAILIGVMTLVAAGCSKKEQPQAATPTATPSADGASQPAQAEPATGTPAVTQPVTTVAQADGQVDMGALQHYVIRWIVANHRRPASFEEFATTAGVAIPPPPAGKKYSLGKDMRVNLVDR
jgi:hypothetical protein